MPYIKSDDSRREALRHGEPALTAGELNYQIFFHIKHFKEIFIGFNDDCKYVIVYTFIRQFLGENPNYQKYNDMTGALIRCKKELKRRLNINEEILINIMEAYDNEIAKYEDKKIDENGDVE
jgi:hypothetical protein